MATEIENRFTVFIRLPFNRGDFVDPPPVAWSAAKERELWEIISRQSKGNEIDWKDLADRFQVTQPFLLQQAAWLYERQLSQVRAQMRRMGSRQSTTASPAPPPSATASVVSAQAARRGGSFSSRAPSRLSTQGQVPASAVETTTPITPARSRASMPFRTSTSTVAPQNRSGTTTRPLSRKSSRDNEPLSRTHSRRGSNQITKSPVAMEAQDLSSSEDEVATSKVVHRRPNPTSTQRRTPSIRKSQHIRQSSISHVDEETEEEDTPAFLPFANEKQPEGNTAPSSDPSATLRGGFTQPVQSSRPVPRRNHTSERILRPPTHHVISPEPVTNLTSSASSVSSSSAHHSRPPAPRPNPSSHARRGSHLQSPSNLPTPLSPTQQAALATAAGLSPRRRPHNNSGAESSPSMGSSFSDLDDASVTQSALEEALMSGMGSVATTATTHGAFGSRVGAISGIGQALRSRYFDARGTGTNPHHSQQQQQQQQQQQ